jgi:hypothetical protein
MQQTGKEAAISCSQHNRKTKSRNWVFFRDTGCKLTCSPPKMFTSRRRPKAALLAPIFVFAAGVNSD